MRNMYILIARSCKCWLLEILLAPLFMKKEMVRWNERKLDNKWEKANNGT